jgi:seryl-tRNA synthetase
MLDVKFVRENVQIVQEACKNKGIKIDVNSVLTLEKKYKEVLQNVEELRKEKNILADKNKGQRPSEEDIAQGKKVKDELAKIEAELSEAEKNYLTEFKKIPNIPTKDVPIGLSEDENVVVKHGGKIPKFKFPVKNHWQIGEAKGWIDKERAAKVTGARFAYLKGDLVRLEWALMRYMMDQLSDEKVIKNLIKKNKLKKY